MPFREEEDFIGPLAIPLSMEVTPEPAEYNASLLGAAFRTENELVSFASSFSFDPSKQIDPDFRPWESIQGTKYEPYASRFVGAADETDMAMMRLQIDREMEDRSVVSAAGALGWGAAMGASILSPTSLLPGGALVKAGKGIDIARTGLKVGMSAAAATAVQEAFLQGTQQTRTTGESAFAIGGSFILGGLLGAAAGKMTNIEFARAAADTETGIKAVYEMNDALRSMGAAGAGVSADDLKLRREGVFQAVNHIPVLRGIVRTSPVMRNILDESIEVRRQTVQLVDTPMQFAANAEGRSIRGPESSVESALIFRTNQELGGGIAELHRSFAEYWKDGPVGMVGTITAPITSKYMHLLGKDKKLSATEFMDEVGKAMRRNDKHPIPQVQRAADALRRDIFDKIKDEAIEVGIFDPSLNVKFADSYFSRIYVTEKIKRHFGDGTENDIMPVLKQEFERRRGEAQKMLAEDDTVNRLEIDRLQLNEQVRQDRGALKRATDKAVAARELAKAAVGREGAVQRVSGTLRKWFKDRQANLSAGVPDKEAVDALRESVKQARQRASSEPTDILKAIRSLGGIKDTRSGGMWNGLKGWTKNMGPTEIENLLGPRASGIRRGDGMDIDMMREALAERGYLPMDSTVDDLMDLIGRAAGGERIYSVDDLIEAENFKALSEFADELDRMGVNINDPIEKIIIDLHGANNRAIPKAKAGEAGRSAKAAGTKADAAQEALFKAIDRVEEAKARVTFLREELGPKVREDIAKAHKELSKVKSELATARKAREEQEFYANKSDEELGTDIRETVQSLLNMKPGHHSAEVALSSPTRARVLDVSDELLEPWLVSNAEHVLHAYTRSMLPQIEMARRFGDVNATEAIRKMSDDIMRRAEAAKSPKEKKRIIDDGAERIKDFEGMRDRMLGRYGVPDDATNGWVQAGRTARTLSYMGHLGAMTIAAIPDVAGIIGRASTDAFGVALTGMTNPKRLFDGLKGAADFGSAAEWHLNSRAMALGDLTSPYGQGSKLDRMLGEGARQFGIVSLMIPWNAAWKSIGGAAISSRMSKAIVATADGKATAKQKLLLGANDISPWQADRIAKQLMQHGDMNGMTWLPQGRLWTDKEAFDTFGRAMNREMNLMVITPGQDKPLSFSTELGKIGLQFKSFSASAHNRILLAGIQRADAETLAQVITAIVLGGLVSNIRADLGGYDRKEGTAFWEDAVDRAGLAGWLFEPYNAVSAMTGGKVSISGEPVSRFQARSFGAGLAGPTFDMGAGMIEGINALSTGKASYRDIRKVMKPIPGNNIFYLNGQHVLALFSKVENALVEATGAKPRQ